MSSTAIDENTAIKVERGLEGVVAAATEIAEVNGTEGRLILRGYDVNELKGRVTFEEVAYLLWHGRLPDATDLEALQYEMSRARELPPPTLKALREVAPYASGMDILRMGASMLSLDPLDVDQHFHARSHRKHEVEPNLIRAARLQAQMPAIVAHTWRLGKGLDICPPKPEHGLAEGFLYMLEAEEPDPARVEALNAYFFSIAEHGLNASTFTARVVVSTDSDMISAITAAIGALKGPKHGGVPGPVLKMMTEIRTPDRAEAYIRNEMREERRIMGFGHRVYKVRDPRAALLEDAAVKMAQETGHQDLLLLTKAVEETTVRVLAELKPGRDLYANVELYAALILHSVGIPSTLFTPLFAIGRTSGWTAHMIEQLKDNRLIRPQSVYVGPRDLKWKPINQR